MRRLGRHLSPDGEPVDLPLPLVEHDGVWLAGDLSPTGHARESFTRWRRRPDLDAALTHLSSRRLPRSGGAHRAMDEPLAICVTQHLAAVCVGWQQGVVELLDRVWHVGKKRSQGYGRVAEWHVRNIGPPAGADRVFVDDSGRATRPVPTRTAVELNASGRVVHGGYRPPYWWRPWWTQVVVP